MSASSPNHTANSGPAPATKVRAISPGSDASLLPHVREAVNGISKYSIMSQLGNDAIFALRKSIDDILASSEASTAVAGSSCTPSPSSSRHSHNPPSTNEAGGGNCSAQFGLESQGRPPTSSRSWVRNQYPLHAAAIDEPEAPQSVSEQSSPTPKPPGRAPGADQLRANMSGSEDGQAQMASSPTPRSDGEATPVPNTSIIPHDPIGRSAGRWRRQRYPPQSTLLTAQSQQSPESLCQSADAGSNYVVPPSHRTDEQHASRVAQVCPMRHQSATSQTEQYPHRSLYDESTSSDTTVPLAERGRGRSRTKSAFSRQTYPLQTPARATNLRGSPSPPPSPVKTDLSQATDSARPNKRGSHMKQSRGAYPLHSPPSIVQLRAPPSPPSSSEGDHETPARTHEPQGAGPAIPRQQKRTYRRMGYPLQNSASLAELRPLAEDVPTLLENNTVSTVQGNPGALSEPTRAQEESNRFRQRAYPLQPSSGPVPKPSTSLQPPPLEITTTRPDQSTSVDSEESPGTSNRSKHVKRRSYPLASKPSVPAFKFSPPTPPSEDDVQVKPTGDTGSSRKEDLASKVLKQWRRQVYPTQDSESLIRRTLTPKASQESICRSPSPGPRFLPKNLRAVKDSTAPSHQGRTIIVCLDGTGDKFDNDNSNIVHFVSALKKDDPKQVSYYQAGIGTYNEGGLNTGFSAAMDMAVGSELGLHVRDAYQFLMHSYKEGDKICILGFSRGAYTARCLAGMVHKVGLLPPRNLQQIHFAYQFYADDSAEGWKSSGDFKATFSIDVSVYFMGCFDSVASVGFIPRQLPLSTTPTNKAQFFRHAMALDERRAKFKVCRYETVGWDDIQMGTSQTEKKSDNPGRHSLHEKYGPSYHPNVTDEEYDRLEEPDVAYDTDVKEVWFVGCHADVGGGAVANSERHKLAQIPLRWMIRQAFECNTGIRFKTKKLAEFGIDVHTLWPQYHALSAPSHGPPPSLLEKYEKGLPPRSVRRGKLVPTEQFDQGERLYHLKSHKDEDWTPEQTEDFFDAMAPLNDQLVQVPNWWILEVWPVQYKVPVAPGETAIRTGMNLGRYRAVGDIEPNLHWTVLQRMHHLGYKIQVRMAPHTKWKIVV